jgi:hypothetical protein
VGFLNFGTWDRDGSGMSIFHLICESKTESLFAKVHEDPMDRVFVQEIRNFRESIMGGPVDIGGSLRFAKRLVDLGAHPHLKDNEGRTPFDIVRTLEFTTAQERSDKEIYKSLRRSFRPSNRMSLS